MKVLYNGEEIDIDTNLEKGEMELDLFDEEDSDLEDTIEIDLSYLKDVNVVSNKIGDANYE